MEHRCLEPDELVRLLDAPPDDARRTGAAACPRCDCLLRAAACFLEGDDAVPADEHTRAERALADALAQHLATPGSAAAPVDGRSGRPTRAARARGRNSRRAGWGWGLGLAAVLTGTMIVTSRAPLSPTGPTGVLRGGAPTPNVAAGLVVTVAARAADGTVGLSWPAVEGATAYQVELFTAALDTVAVLAAPGPAVTVGADVAARSGDQAAVLCRVRAALPGGESGVSPLRPIRLR